MQGIAGSSGVIALAGTTGEETAEECLELLADELETPGGTLIIGEASSLMGEEDGMDGEDLFVAC